ncbi:hypothetical protein EDM57_19995 [Brevibacillus gelatini]|uniref:Uncharacterized protein n=1 Tax=Brevibacillus gelatini TaxID=1655277 RepID=A0A3M8API0_9BACL|nr:hypothetical protein [Brevibacillus gelatini]RNB53114.1 hypothetical protein EDM57_19995 [Brevibacillus gelatini]
MTKLVQSKADAVRVIQEQIDEGRKVVLEEQFSSWKMTTSRVLDNLFSDQTIGQSFAMQTFGSIKNGSHFLGITYLENLIHDINRGLFKGSGSHGQIDVEHFHVIVRRVLSNFHKHIQEMYQKPVHGGGTLKGKDLQKIVLGNEYDVQRMLYSLIRPIFPEARAEIYQDGGYKSYRYDIFIDAYETVIEVKCSRPSMQERELTEQIGSDAFHYQEKYIYFFVYDKHRVIANVDAFCQAYRKSLETHEKQIETVVIQPISI